MTRLRKRNELVEKWCKEWDENPIVEKLEDEFPEKKTDVENIKELQKILVQTTIDYLKEHELTDVDAVYFSFDGAQDSVDYGEWTPSSDSSIKLNGLAHEVHRRKNGELFKMPYHYEIGSWM